MGEGNVNDLSNHGVIEQVGDDTRAFFRFATPVIIGTIDDIVVPPSPKTVLFFISDTVGPAVIRFSDVENAEQFIVTNRLENGKHVLLEGPLEISNIRLDDNAYPCVTVSAHAENMRISFPSNESSHGKTSSWIFRRSSLLALFHSGVRNHRMRTWKGK